MKMVDKMINELHNVVFGVVLSRNSYYKKCDENSPQTDVYWRILDTEIEKANCLAMACIHVFGVTPQYINEELRKSFDYLIDSEEYGTALEIALKDILFHTQTMVDHEND